MYYMGVDSGKKKSQMSPTHFLGFKAPLPD
jgi:hypothetical protein